MSSLTSSSTLAEVLAAYEDNASYEENASTTEAAAFITACRFLLIRLPKHVAGGGAGGEEVDYDLATIRAELKAASQWRSLMAGAASVKHLSFQNFR